MDRVLTEKVKKSMLDGGVDLVGFAPVDRWKNAPFLISPMANLEGAKCVIVGAMHITETWTELAGQPSPQDNSGPGGWRDHNSMLDRIGYRTARMLTDLGYKAVPIAASNIWRYRDYKDIPSVFAPDLSHMHASVAAGLTEIGWSGLAITPEYGNRIRFVSIVTDADLVETPMYDGPALCDRCGECIKHCPSAALRKDFNSATPHTVEIGGKIFKYANKNIWRCAWAEHFNLNLDSSRLAAADHVDEKLLIDEVNRGALRGHERGVCQRVCVPPHLRVEGQLFHQNYVNRKYPDVMPTLRKMRDDLEAIVAETDVELCITGALDKNAEASQIIMKELPGAASIMALALEIPEYPHKDAGYYYAASYKLHHLMIRLERTIEELGYWAASSVDTKRIISCWASDSSGKLAHNKWDVYALAEQAGLGKIDADGQFITPEFGNRVIVGVVITNAKLPASPNAGTIQSTRYPRLEGAALKKRLQIIADANLVSHFGVTKAETLTPLVSQLKRHFNDEELGSSVIDTSGKPHGAWISEIRQTRNNIKTPEERLPGAKSVVVLGMYYSPAVIENSGLEKSKQVGTYAFQQYQTAFELEFAGFELVKALHRMGYKARLSDNLLGVGSKVDTPRGEMADARSNALEAYAAGLADIGLNGAALVPGYGPHVRFMTLVTDAEIPADNVYSGRKLCTACGECSKKCPMQALSKETFTLDIAGNKVAYPCIDRFRCDWSKRYSLCPEEGPSLIGNNTAVAVPEKITIQDLADGCSQKDQVMKQRTCILETCLRNCPAK